MNVNKCLKMMNFYYILIDRMSLIAVLQDPVKQVAVKSFTGGPLSSFIGGPLSSQVENLPQIYADIRVELNKLITVDHPHIINLIGFCVTSLSFVLEWAPLGSLKSLLLESYKSAGFHFCPEALFHTIKQVICFLKSRKYPFELDPHVGIFCAGLSAH